MRCTKPLRLWCLQKTQAYPKVRRGFLQVRIDANPKVYAFEGVGNRSDRYGRTRVQEIGADRRQESLISGFGVGNDVVDLDDPETATEGLNRRFDRRVFSADELRRLAVADDARTLRWTLWAAKESAYKLAKRSDPETVFAHSLFQTDLGEYGCWTVRHGEWSCAVSVSHEGSAIHAIATPDHCDRQRVITGLGHVLEGDDPSARVRELATKLVARHLQIEPAVITITAGEHRIPVLRVDGQPLGHLSLSHHGTLSAFAWMAPQG